MPRTPLGCWAARSPSPATPPRRQDGRQRREGAGRGKRRLKGRRCGEAAGVATQARGGTTLQQEREFAYPNNELYVKRPDGGYYRLDPTNPGLTSSRARRRSSAISRTRRGSRTCASYPRSTRPARGVLTYPAPATRLRGGRLEGKMFLEIPVQKGPIPQSVLTEATRLDIRIRDVTGRVYNSAQ